MGGGGGSITTDGYAGIGGPNFDEATNYTGAINIESGTITATGYSYGAGIGGGNFSSGGTINISGGVVTALSGGTDPDGWVSVPENTKMGAGIGGSQGCGSGGINISGGIVKAYGGYGCPGIGGAPCDVTISGSAVVTGYGGDLAAGIGGYDKYKGESNEITISDTATVTGLRRQRGCRLGGRLRRFCRPIYPDDCLWRKCDSLFRRGKSRHDRHTHPHPRQRPRCQYEV